MSEEITIEIDQKALEAVPIFPLPGTVLLPHTLVSLHIFEPRYRQMMAYCLDTHRVLAVAMLDEKGEPDCYGRPPIYSTAGLGYVRRSARLPDGRYNLVLEGVARIDVSQEHPPETAFRRAHALLLEDQVPEHQASTVDAASHALRALCARAFSGTQEQSLLEAMHTLEPGRLADSIAASAVEDSLERQLILETTDILKRLEVVSGVLGTLLLDRVVDEEDEAGESSQVPRWGIVPGKA